MRRLLSLLACTVAVSSVSAQIRPELRAGIQDTDPTTGAFVFTGNPVVVVGNDRIAADRMSYDAKLGVVQAEGHVELSSGPRRLLAERLTYDLSNGSYHAERLRLGEYPLYISGRTAEGTRTSATVTDALVFLREPGIFAPTLKASKLTYSAGQVIAAEKANAGVGPALPITLPKLSQKINEPALSYISLAGGYRASLGAFIDAGLHLPVSGGLQLGGNLGVYTARGVMFGPSGSYRSASDPDALRGVFRTGYINDHGNRKNDLLNRPIPADRSFVEWTHQQLINENLSLNAQLNFWKDSYILRDFRPSEFFRVQEPDTYVESVYQSQNYFVSLFARFQPNRYHIVQERLPEVRFDLLPTPLGQGFYEQFNASAAVLREDDPPAPAGDPSGFTGNHLRSNRLDAYYGITRPVVLSDWSTFTPVVGGRLTHYANTKGAASDGDYTRTLGQVGFDAEMRSSATFNYKNERWKIDGLRHLLTPRLSYRYIPEGDRGQGQIPQIDRDVRYSSYLPTLDLGDQRNIDQLHARNTLRVGVDNTLQTRDANYGSRDLVMLNVAADFRFHRQPGERDVSEVHTELALMPAPWLQVDVYESFAPQSFTLREFNSGLTIHDGNAWRLRFGNNFLRRDSEEYFLEGSYRMTEAYEALGGLRYDARNRRFVEQFYGIRQNLSNQWNIEYAVTLYDGPRRESKFGLRVQIDLIKF